MRIGVQVNTTTSPPASGNNYNTASAFMIGLGDWGPTLGAVQCQSINDVTNTIGPRSTTNSTLWDAADVYFREGGGILFLSVVTGPTPVNASLTLQDVTPHPTVVVTSKYAGTLGNATHVAVVVSGPNYTVNLTDGSGNALGSFGPFATAGGNAPLLASTSPYVTFTQSAGSGFTTAGPNTLSSAPLTGGTDNRGSAVLANYTASLAAFPLALGPGQVSAPGITNTTLAGIWSALGAHAASAVNRVAVCDMNDGETAATVISDLASFGTSSVASYCAFWAGNVVVPSATNVPGTSRIVAPSPIISALCARVDNAGNPNQAAAGDPNGYDLALKYASGFTGVNGAPLYAQSDIDTLNAAGVNTWNNVFGVLQNYGFATSVSPLADTIACQFNHARMRMALEAVAQIVGQPFVFSQISQIDIGAFSQSLATSLDPFVKSGAISTIAPDGTIDQGFVVDTGSTQNTPTTMAAGALNAKVAYRPAPFAQLVTVTLNAVPTTSAL